MKSYSSLLPSINRNHTETQSKKYIFPQPSLHRIKYPPLSDSRTKENRQNIMVQSCISNVPVFPPRNSMTISSTKKNNNKLPKNLHPAKMVAGNCWNRLLSISEKKLPFNTTISTNHWIEPWTEEI